MSCRSGAILRKTARNASRGDGAHDLHLGDRRARSAAANEIVAKTTTELHTNVDSRQRGGVTGPDGR
jgi:hypothetical protein